jgi:MoaA/NifB/PqqE/SkfB family radical SAM enzyme
MIRGITLLATKRCDLHCEHCLRGYPQDKTDFPLPLLDKLLTEAMTFGAKHVGLTGGEPHLHREFDQLVERIMSYGYSWGFASHGQRTEPYLPLMEKYRDRFKYARLSLDGAIPATHDEVRGRKGSFEHVVESAKLYKERGFPVYFVTSLNQKNKGEVQALINLAEAVGVKGITFSGTIPARWNQHLVLKDKEAVELFQQISEARKEKNIEIRTASALHTKGGINFCNALNMKTLAVNSDGELIFCCDTIENGAVIGSLHDENLLPLVQKELEYSAKLQTQRASQIADGNMREGFDTCAFCNQYFDKQIHKPIQL